MENEGLDTTNKDKIHTSPTKDFFIKMITKDISLNDCILDLLDNCIDGANRITDRTNGEVDVNYSGKYAKIIINGDKFFIEDNCGGITLDDAIDYAFHFGRRSDAPEGSDGSIGLYGIGMKRAIFKMGRIINIKTSTQSDAFKIPIDVEAWSSDPDNWDLDIDTYESQGEPGTILEVENLYNSISDDFSDVTFINELRKIIGRDYSFIIQKGFEIYVNEEKVPHYDFKLAFGEDFKPISYRYDDEGAQQVSVMISSGMAGSPPEDIEDEYKLEMSEYYGWFVLCNDRIVLASDKTSSTVWGTDGFPGWHPQYKGFMGIVSFHSNTPNLLPWTTTKRGVDTDNALYRRAIVKMKEATRPFITYTNQRKDDMDRAKEKESTVPYISLFDLEENKEMKMPIYSEPSEKIQKIKTRTITYTKPEDKVKEVASTLGNRNMSLKDVGISTFNYYYENEVEE